MRRFFMTIPEACQLVLQSSTMGKGGEIFVLDMGDPSLSGLRPDEDIKIEFTGVRPGEKLFEELSTYDENTLPTHHEKGQNLRRRLHPLAPDGKVSGSNQSGLH
jgi:FlaA1/EpsC-like NDP-sugar epimerase